MQRRFQLWCVIAVEHGVKVNWEGYACAAKFDDALHWLQAPGHTDLINLFAKRSDVADDINETGFGELRAGGGALLFPARLVELCLEPADLFGQLLQRRARCLRRFLTGLRQDFLIAGLFRLGVFAGLLQLALGALFLPNLLPDASLLFTVLILAFFKFVRQAELVQLEVQVFARDCALQYARGLIHLLTRIPYAPLHFRDVV